MNIYSQENILNKSVSFFGHGKISTQKFYFENLTKRINNILFKTKHLIHLTKKGFKN